ncbi:2 TM domain-containing transmembrane protein [Acrasis kona]|uniref:2 TM domain-containing transmembrane protein n=1 Tax=Acrasis kona TaxID=1008807 RepID=A0AAW2YQE5_9EUKA
MQQPQQPFVQQPYVPVQPVYQPVYVAHQQQDMQQPQPQHYYGAAPYFQPQQQVYSEVNAFIPAQEDAAMREEESTAKLLFILGFLIGWAWLFAYFKYKSSRSNGARKFGRWSGVAFLTSLLLSLLFGVAFVGFYMFVILGSIVGGHF